LQINLVSPPQVSIGEPFDLQVDILNDSNSVLSDAKLMVEVPDGIVFIGEDSDKTIVFRDLGDIGAGGALHESFRVLAISDSHSVKDLNASVSYLPSSIGSRFERSSKTSVSILGESLVLDIDSSTKVFSGESFDITIKYENSSDVDVSGAKLHIEFPPAFSFTSATPKPSEGNNVWEIGTISKGENGEIKIKGALTGPDDAFYSVVASISADFDGRSYDLAEKSASISISPAPLSVSLVVNRDPNYVAGLNDDLNYSIAYRNNTDVALREVVLAVKLSGALYDISSISSNAFVRSSDNALVWNASNIPSFGVLPPGSSGSVDFRIKTLGQYPIQKLSDKNFILKASAEIESPTVPYSVSANKTSGSGFLETKVSGRISLDTKSYFRDASSGFVNGGSMPLHVGKTTNFTIHWVLASYAADMGDVKLKANLGPNVVVTSNISSTISSKPVYNERTQELVWDVGGIAAGKGVLTKPVEAIIQVAATPSVSQVGSNMLLLSETTLTATDLFTNLDYTVKSSSVRTDQLTDTTVSGSDGRVDP